MKQARQSAASDAATDRFDAELADLRERIDAIDRELLAALNARASLVQQVGELKRRSRAAIYSAGRERDLVARLVAENPGPFPSGALPAVYREILSALRALEGPVRVAFLGPDGTYSHLAARQQFGAQAELLPSTSISEVFAAVERGRAELGVVPIENTTEGVVTPTLDVLVESDVPICGEVVLPISHSLLSRSGRLADVKRVASMPQALSQCRRWLDLHLPAAARIETTSTAAAAKLASEDGSVGAIGSAIAAEVYGLETVEAAIEDRRDNTTRFLLIGGDCAAPSGNDLTTAAFTVRKDESGALHRLLAPFARHGVNLASIQSRPLPGKPWEYVFFVDVEGHRDEPRVAQCLAEAASCAHSHRILGSFPRAASLAPGGRG
ncbi:MAG TPA: prephenate dehydratase [Myxococcota bacterium]|jgi:chorismate mutase/prephenate dehydratase|nr:prephenate dehydratase [Myxococcota bacterium]